MSEHEPGLRERKKAKTRLSISQIATKVALHRAFHTVVDAMLPRILSSDGGFVRTLDASPALRARAGFAFDKAEVALGEAIAEETGAAKGDMVLSVERMLILRGDASGAAKRGLRRTCDRAFELLESGVRGYGRRGKEP